MNLEHFPKQAKEADIALLLESSYPFILGGVSAWVHQIIENFPQYTFALIFLGGAPENYKEGLRYKLPKNVVHLQVHYLFDENEPAPPEKPLVGNKKGFDYIETLHKSFACPHLTGFSQIEDMSIYMQGVEGVSYEDFLYSERSWDYINKEYDKQCGDSSFIDYFWTVKNIHKPLWKLTNILNQLPKVKLVHSVSTGYAGLLSFLIQRRFGYPVILTEHGIYTKERKIDIFLSTIFREDTDRPLTESHYLRKLWDRYFITLAKLSYNVANPIVSLFKHAHNIQISEGAPPEKAIVIPNGVDIERYKLLRKPLDEKYPVVCFVGRLVPMKDVKGFIRAIPNLHNQLPDYQFWIVGSTDQDPKYAQECVELVENIMMQEVIEFFDHQQMENVLPRIKILVLSAIRESMPLVILESFAAGVPVVVTDVGACREMVLGADEEDIAIGPAGKVVKVADPRELELAIKEILDNPQLWEQMSKSAIKRAERYYNQQTMIEKYQQLYEKAMT